MGYRATDPPRGTHLPTEMYDISRPGAPTFPQKCKTFRRRGDPPTYRNVRRRHRNLPTLEKERNPVNRSFVPACLQIYIEIT